MPHTHNILDSARLQLTKEQGTVASIKPTWLGDVIRKRYPDPYIFGRLHTHEVYCPTDVTDEVEAAIFAAAWKLGGWPLRQKFGTEGVISLFERFRPYGLVRGSLNKSRDLVVHRGTNDSDYIRDKAPMSWSISNPMARQFALNSGKSRPLLVSGTVSTLDVLMSLQNDAEKEVVVLPGSVSVRKCTWPRNSAFEFQ